MTDPLPPSLPVRQSPRALLSVAPMMDRTDRHCRYFLRQISRCTLLYTEMIAIPAVLRGDRPKLLGFSPVEKPLALQIGGDDPQLAARCARIAQDWGYDEVNLNVGCPSDRVQNGNFGACLMGQPQRVAEIVAAMQAAVTIPVTVKHRIGIDNRDRYEDLWEFVRIVAEAGCRHFTVHARKAWLQGLSPKENRTVPPLRYGDAYRLKQDFPHLCIEINGGIATLAAARTHLQAVDAVMIGRAVYENPYLLAAADGELFGATAAPPSRQEVVAAMVPYIAEQMARGVKLHAISRHMLQLFAGQPGTKAWKRYLGAEVSRPGAGVETIRAALARVSEAASSADARGARVGPEESTNNSAPVGLGRSRR